MGTLFEVIGHVFCPTEQSMDLAKRMVREMQGEKATPL